MTSRGVSTKSWELHSVSHPAIFASAPGLMRRTCEHFAQMITST